MKKEFEGAATASGGGNNVFEPKLVTIPDETAAATSSGTEQLGGQCSSINSAITPEGNSSQASTKETNAISDELSLEAAANAAAAALPPLPPQGTSKVPLAAKLENTRKFSQTISSEGAEFDIEENEEDFDPHFQRVYISGDDNTGVRLFFWRLQLHLKTIEVLSLLRRYFLEKNGPRCTNCVYCAEEFIYLTNYTP